MLSIQRPCNPIIRGSTTADTGSDNRLSRPDANDKAYSPIIAAAIAKHV